MKPFGMLALILVVAALTACQAPQQDTDVEEQLPAPEDIEVDETVDDLEQEVDELDNLTEDLDMSDLEGLEEDLENI